MIPGAGTPARALAGVLLAAALLPACGARRLPPLSTPPVVDARDPRVRALQRDLALLLDVPLLGGGLAAVVVRSADRGDTLFRYHENALVLPASSLKIVTLAAAAERLGWEHTFSTTLRAAGPVDGGVLHGDLVVVGTGDPAIGWPGEPASAVMDRWTERLWQAGVRHVDGRLVGDDRAFAGDALGEGWAWDDLPWGYSAPVSALQANVGAVQLHIVPGAREGEPAEVTLTPPEGGLGLEATVATGPPDAAASLSLARRPGSEVLTVAGVVPAGAEPIVRTAAVERPTHYFLALLEAALARRGILVRDGARAIAGLPPGQPADGTLIFEHRSPPLRTLAGTLMKASQNQYAETLLRALGRSAPAGQGTAEQGREVVRQVLEAWGLPPGSLVQADGSGLSRHNLVTAGTLADVLARMHADPRHREPWLAALAVGGVDGTLERRFRGTAVSGRVRAKTGTLSNTRALAGYVPAASGEPLLFVIVLNHVTASAQELSAIADGIVLRLAAFTR